MVSIFCPLHQISIVSFSVGKSTLHHSSIMVQVKTGNKNILNILSFTKLNLLFIGYLLIYSFSLWCLILCDEINKYACVNSLP